MTVKHRLATIFYSLDHSFRILYKYQSSWPMAALIQKTAPGLYYESFTPQMTNRYGMREIIIH